MLKIIKLPLLSLPGSIPDDFSSDFMTFSPRVTPEKPLDLREAFRTSYFQLLGAFVMVFLNFLALFAQNPDAFMLFCQIFTKLYEFLNQAENKH